MVGYDLILTMPLTKPVAMQLNLQLATMALLKAMSAIELHMTLNVLSSYTLACFEKPKSQMTHMTLSQFVRSWCLKKCLCLSNPTARFYFG